MNQDSEVVAWFAAECGQWVRDAEQVVEAVKTAMYSSDTDLRLPSIAWDSVRLLGELPGLEGLGRCSRYTPTAVYDEIAVEIYKHWMAASPVVDDEISGIARKTNDINMFMSHMLIWCHPGI
jgi:hypothetical protein